MRLRKAVRRRRRQAGDSAGKRLRIEPLEPRLVMAVVVDQGSDAVSDQPTGFNGPAINSPIVLPGSAENTGSVIEWSVGAQVTESVEVTVSPAWAEGEAAPTYFTFGRESVYQTAGSRQWFQGDEFFAVDTTQHYTLSGWAKSGDEYGLRYQPQNLQSFGVVAYDTDLLPILGEHVLRFAGSADTTLAAPLESGQTTVVLTDASGWSNDADAGTRALAWYGYRDGDGNLYDDYTYTRNVATGGEGGLWEPGAVAGNVITLSEPWQGGLLPAGTAVRNAVRGPEASFLAIENKTVGGDWDWSQQAGVFGGGEMQQGQDTPGAFRPGTAYVKPVIYANQHGDVGNFVSWREVSLRRVGEGVETGDVLQPVVELGGDQGRAALTIVPDSNLMRSEELVAVDTAETYTLAARHTGGSTADGLPVKFASLDADQKEIHPLHVTKHADAADTRLAWTLLPGDTSLLIDNASGWSHEAWLPAESRSLAWYGYTDDSGTTYADYTYTRNVAFDFDDGLWDPGAIRYDAEYGAYRIALREPWSGPALAAGRAVRNAAGGSFYSEPFTFAEALPGEDAEEYRLTIGGGEWVEGRRDESAFRPGTRYIQPVLQSVIIAREVFDGPPWSVTTPGIWDGLSIGLAEEIANSGPVYTMTAEVDPTGDGRVTLDLDVLSQNPFGDAATVVIDAVAAPLHGAASIVTASGGGQLLSYESTPGFTGVDVVTYTLRDTVSSETVQVSTTITARDASVREVEQRLADIALALVVYEDVFREFPVTNEPTYFGVSGKPHVSWRVHVLPYLGYQELYDRFRLDEPWDSANNLPLLTEMPDVFRSIGDASDSTTTRFQTFNGPDALFGFRPAGENQRGPRLWEIADDRQHTLLVAESSQGTAVPWTKPEDMAFDTADPWAAVGDLGGEDLRSATADGKLLRLSPETPAETFSALVTRDGGELVDAYSLRRLHAEQNGGRAAVKSYGASTADEYFRMLGIALLNFVDRRSFFPADVYDTSAAELDLYSSWRQLLLPELGYGNLAERFDPSLRWDSPQNLALAQFMPDVFRGIEDLASSDKTRLMSLVGQGIGMQSFPYRLNEEPTGGPPDIGSQPRLRTNSFVDGLPHTSILFEGGPDTADLWTKPFSPLFDFSDPLAPLGDLSAGEVRTITGNAERLTLGTDIDPALFVALNTRAGGSTESLVDGESLLAREQRRKGGSYPYGSRENQFRRLATSLLDYADRRVRFPTSIFDSDGTPLLSWRVQVLRDLGFGELYGRFRRDEPWDSPHNLALIDEMPNIFSGVAEPLAGGLTGLTGFDGESAPFNSDWLFRLEFRNFRDGTRNTISLAETNNRAPWTKPFDTPFHHNNPLSPLGELGEEFVVAYFDGSVRPLAGDLSPSALSAWITYNGEEDPNNPPSINTLPGVFVNQTAGDTKLNEFGIDYFTVVLDKAPETDVVVSVTSGKPGVALLDKALLTFTPEDWFRPQRVAVRGVDNFEMGPDATVGVVIGVVDEASDADYQNLQYQLFLATVVDDDRLPADVDGSGRVDGGDFAAWDASFGQDAGGDADVDGDTDVFDLLALQRAYPAPPPASDFDGDGFVDADDLDTLFASLGSGAGGDADGDGDTDVSDLLRAQREFSQPKRLGDFRVDGRVDGSDLAQWRASFGVDGGANTDRDADSDLADLLAWQRSYTGVAAVSGLSEIVAGVQTESGAAPTDGFATAAMVQQASAADLPGRSEVEAGEVVFLGPERLPLAADSAGPAPGEVPSLREDAAERDAEVEADAEGSSSWFGLEEGLGATPKRL